MSRVVLQKSSKELRAAEIQPTDFSFAFQARLRRLAVRTRFGFIVCFGSFLCFGSTAHRSFAGSAKSYSVIA